MTGQEIFEELERMVDATNLGEVLDQLSRVCDAKAEHIRSNWQDEKTADNWQTMQVAIDRVIVKCNV